MKNDCCNEPDPDQFNYSEEEDDKDDTRDISWEPCEEKNKCQHECFKHGSEILCKCKNGYTLDKDEYSCNENVSDALSKAAGELQAPDELKINHCNVGFKKNEVNECVDIDECKQNPCKFMGKCKNTVGSFTCQPVDFCPTGYKFDHYKEKCEPKTCDVGYKLDTDTGSCVDIDECLTVKCDRNQKCYNTEGSYRCDCGAGFQRNSSHPLICTDINECHEFGFCDQNCYNTWGGYRCSCKYGYKLDTDGRTCNDVNECEIRPKYLCQGTCRNTFGSYSCDCPEGTTLSDNRHNCNGKLQLFALISINFFLRIFKLFH